MAHFASIPASRLAPLLLPLWTWMALVCSCSATPHPWNAEAPLPGHDWESRQSSQSDSFHFPPWRSGSIHRRRAFHCESSLETIDALRTRRWREHDKNNDDDYYYYHHHHEFGAAAPPASCFRGDPWTPKHRFAVEGHHERHRVRAADLAAGTCQGLPREFESESESKSESTFEAAPAGGGLFV